MHLVAQNNRQVGSWLTISLSPELELPYLKGLVDLPPLANAKRFQINFWSGTINGGDDSACVIGVLGSSVYT